ncbi:MAG: tryptophan--tRNA ligase [Thermoproteota archaeon]|nr:tryptophan--tRNA ligase [Thermoproteota archaeon]
MNFVDDDFDHRKPEDDGTDFKVTPWEVEGDVNYGKLIEKFGTQPITNQLLQKIKSITGEIHPLLKVGYFFSHRDFDWIIDNKIKGQNFYLYTGRGPSGMVHMGHLMPWIFTKYLQDKFESNLLFQLTDDEKYLYGQDRTMKEIQRYTYENILDIIAVGFDPRKTKIIVNTKHIQQLYPIAIEIAKRITFSTTRAVFGFSNSTNIGMIGFPAIQAAPCFLPSIIEGKNVPVLIPAAIDQDPYWRITRDIAERLHFYKPAQIHSKFLPGLGMLGKMSSSRPETAIFTTDDPEVIDRKVATAFTGGQATIALQRQLGANAFGCPVFWYLRYFFDTEKQSDERLLRCKSGDLLCGECKSDLSKGAKPFIVEFKRRREKAKDVVDKFMYDETPPPPTT